MSFVQCCALSDMYKGQNISQDVLLFQLAKESKAARTAPGSKYMVDGSGDKKLQSADKGIDLTHILLCRFVV